jgi:hypothetical protein
MSFLRGLLRFALEVVSTIVLVVFYFVVITALGGAMRLLGRNPLRHRPGALGFWQPHRGAADRRAMERQS